LADQHSFSFNGKKRAASKLALNVTAALLAVSANQIKRQAIPSPNAARATDAVHIRSHLACESDRQSASKVE
jgi:hypothetical protein